MKVCVFVWVFVMLPIFFLGVSIGVLRSVNVHPHRSGTNHEVFLTPLAGYAPPLGCSCRRGDGVTAGCANHKSLSPPWLGVEGGEDLG